MSEIPGQSGHALPCPPSCTAAKLGWSSSSLSDFARLFDHLVRERQEVRSHSKIQRLGRLKIDHESKFTRLLNRQITGLCPAKNLRDIGAGAPKTVQQVARVRHQKTGAAPFRVCT